MRFEDEREVDTLMARLADGEREAFDPLFRALYPRALRLGRARLRDEARAADAAQGALVKLFAHADDFEPGRAVLPWFYAILANELRAVARDAARGARDDRALDALIDEGDPEASLALRELRAGLDMAIATLDAPSAKAIAALLGDGARPAIAPAAFRKRVSRAYARLRVLLGGSR